MKTLISDAAGYKTYVEVRKALVPADLFQLRFLTTFDAAKNPTEERVGFEIMLTSDQLQLLKNSI